MDDCVNPLQEGWLEPSRGQKLRRLCGEAPAPLMSRCLGFGGAAKANRGKVLWMCNIPGTSGCVSDHGCTRDWRPWTSCYVYSSLWGGRSQTSHVLKYHKRVKVNIHWVEFLQDTSTDPIEVASDSCVCGKEIQPGKGGATDTQLAQKPRAQYHRHSCSLTHARIHTHSHTHACSDKDAQSHTHAHT